MAGAAGRGGGRGGGRGSVLAAVPWLQVARSLIGITADGRGHSLCGIPPWPPIVQHLLPGGTPLSTSPTRFTPACFSVPECRLRMAFSLLGSTSITRALCSWTLPINRQQKARLCSPRVFSSLVRLLGPRS